MSSQFGSKVETAGSPGANFVMFEAIGQTLDEDRSDKGPGSRKCCWRSTERSDAASDSSNAASIWEFKGEPHLMATLDRWRSFLEVPKTIELVHAELVGRGGHPLVTGTGEIRMTSLQDFSYSMTPTTGAPIAFFEAIEQKRQRPYDGTARFRLRGTDANGVEWGGGWTMPQKISFGPWLIEGRLTALDITDRLAPEAPSTELVFSADLLHPLARVLAVPGNPREKRTEKRFEILGSVIEFAYERAANVVSITASHSAQLPPTYTEQWLTEPLRIMFGQPVVPRLYARNKGGEAIVFITSPHRLEVASWSAFWTDQSSSKPDSFVDCYCQLLSMIALAGEFEPHPVTRFYDELAQVAHASRWVMALTLAGCTEGLAKLLRPKMKASELQEEAQWSKEADDFAKAIEALLGHAALKKRATEAVLQTKGASTRGTLRALQKKGVIGTEQLKAWDDIRHKVMHGNFVSAYSNEDEDEQLSHLIDIMRALTLELLNRTKLS
jgi:hypothetical protein